MPALDLIATTIINSALRAGQFASRKFQTGVWHGLAHLLPKIEIHQEVETKTVQPAVVYNSGESTDVTYNDTYPITFYHRLYSPSIYEDDLNENYGDPGNFVKETADMVMVVIGDRNKLQVLQEDVGAAIWASIPREITQAQAAAFGLMSGLIIPGEVNNESEDVFNQEFKGVEYNLAPQNFMISVRYKIITVYSDSCFNLCN